MNTIDKITGIFPVILLLLVAGPLLCEDTGPRDPNQYFYQGNALYKSGDYANALLTYDKILDMGMESGSLYYNIGNSFFKTGKLGYAVLFYERAKEIMPYDSDLRSNLDFARSLLDETSLEDSYGNFILRVIKRPFRDFNLDKIAIITVGIYFFTVSILAFSVINPMIAKKMRLFIFVIMIACLYSMTVFGLRYYDEEIQKKGIVLVKDLDCKYEPIDKSSTFFKLREGAEVIILSTGDGWRQVRRSDGKAGWINKEAVEPI